MTLTEHLGELRVRIIRSALAITIGMVLDHRVLRPGARVPDAAVRGPVRREAPRLLRPELFNFSPTEGLATRLRVGMYGGIILALPVILWQIWRFIVPALNAKEKKYAIPFVMSSVVLFARRRRARLPDGRSGARIPHLLGRRRRRPDLLGEQLRQPHRPDDLRLRRRVPAPGAGRVPPARRAS